MKICFTRLALGALSLHLCSMESLALSSVAFGYGQFQGVLQGGVLWAGPAVAYRAPSPNASGYSVGGLYRIDPAAEVARTLPPLSPPTSLCRHDGETYLANGKQRMDVSHSIGEIYLRSRCVSVGGN